MPGDELRLKHRNASNRGPWEGLGNVIRFDQTEEVCLELRDSVSGNGRVCGSLFLPPRHWETRILIMVSRATASVNHTPFASYLQSAPDDCTVGYTVEFVWKAISFDRMKTALNTFREYSASISGYIFHSILGHALEPTLLRVQVRNFNSTKAVMEQNHEAYGIWL